MADEIHKYPRLSTAQRERIESFIATMDLPSHSVKARTAAKALNEVVQDKEAAAHLFLMLAADLLDEKNNRTDEGFQKCPAHP